MFYKLIISLTLLFSSLQGQEQKRNLSIGIIVPMEHKSLEEIVQGFKETLNKQEPETRVVIKNAQGDPNLQRMILQQMLQKGIDFYVPLGTSTTQMTCSLIRKAPIISLASHTLTSYGQSRENLVSVFDEVPVTISLNFLKKYFPQLTHFTLLYSAQEKIIPEVKEMEDFCKAQGIILKKVMIQTHQDLYTLGKTLPQETQALFILKDHLVVSSVPLLLQEAQKRRIPLIACDEGSVQRGAHFAIGISERSIGEAGASLVHELIQGKKITELKSIHLQDLRIFAHKNSLSFLPSSFLETLQKAQQEEKYPLILIEGDFS